MITVLKNSWALLLGMMLLMVGNGLQGTLLGVRGAMEGYDASTMSLVMSAYFVGILGGSRWTPRMIRHVGHVRVFAFLASLISAVFILYAALPNPILWTIMRLIVGFCFSGVYVVAESWLNDASSNETRGQALSAYLIVQMIGIVSAQGLLNFGDPGDYTLFVVISVLVSISFAPILLSASPAPSFQSTKPLSLKKLIKLSPLGCVGMFLLGGVFSAMFGMASVYATERGLSLQEISLFMAFLYIGGMLFQYPIGWLSDHMDRRQLIMIVTLIGAAGVAYGTAQSENFYILLLLATLVGAVANPLYSLLIAHTNDYIELDEMAAASGGLMFINGLGAILGPMIVGWMMANIHMNTYWYYIAFQFIVIAVYSAYRMTRREAIPVDEQSVHATVAPQTSPVAMEVAQEIAIEATEEQIAEAEESQSDSNRQ